MFVSSPKRKTCSRVHRSDGESRVQTSNKIEDETDRNLNRNPAGVLQIGAADEPRHRIDRAGH